MTSTDVLLISGAIFGLVWVGIRGWMAAHEADLARCKCPQCKIHDAAKRKELEERIQQERDKAALMLTGSGRRCPSCRWFLRYDGACINRKCDRFSRD